MAALVFLASGKGFCAVAESWEPLMKRLVQDGFSDSYVRSVFERAHLDFDAGVMARKIDVLLDTKLSSSSSSAPVEPKVMERYLNPILLAGAYASLRENHDVLKRIERETGVPGSVVIAVYLVETKLGRTIGNQKAFAVLSNMALGGDFSKIKMKLKHADLSPEMQEWAASRTRQKGNWAYAELVALLRYSQSLGTDPVEIPGSVYGAIGLCQFMPTNALHYGRDGSGDGKVDLFNEADALFSIAYFLKRHGWKSGLDVEQQHKVIYRYNHSMSYALTIMEVADRLDKTDRFFGRN
ncbi:lytic murein transglycosylase [Salidesulfovibrio onnuriiensis]|uniref:lytic murein transglycosylase n=1 Tax=Salidesulfovibrio onnuriiensis TaxID=2583823 RepID=UPI0025461AA6|nr:lytic murein transglycosylase [Salidesulfovibrio onnuriiensis]